MQLRALRPAAPASSRCNALTGGSEVRSLLKAVDGELAAYLGRLQTAVAGVGARHKAAAAAGGGAASPAEDSEEIANVLQLIKVGRELSAQVGRLEAALRTAVAAAVGRLQALASGGGAAASSGGAAPLSPFSAAAGAQALPPATEADPVALRLLAAPRKGTPGSGADRLAKLSQLGASLSDPRSLMLPSSVGALDAFSGTVQSTVFDVLLARVAALLAPLPGLPEWRRAGGPDAGNAAAPLPTFHTYPLPYVTAIGDHLMAMPQQLEVGTAATDGSHRAGGAGGARRETWSSLVRSNPLVSQGLERALLHGLACFALGAARRLNSRSTATCARRAPLHLASALSPCTQQYHAVLGLSLLSCADAHFGYPSYVCDLQFCFATSNCGGCLAGAYG